MNRYFQTQAYNFDLYKPPVETIAKTLEVLQDRFDKNLLAATGIKETVIKSRGADRAEAQNTQDKYSKQVDELVNQYNGDYSQMQKGLFKVATEMKREYQPGGKAWAIESSYQNEQEALSEAGKMLKEGKTNHTAVQALTEYYTKKGPTKQDEYGAWTPINKISLNEMPDVFEIATKAVKDIEPRKVKTYEETVDALGLPVLKEIEKWDYDYAQIQASVQSALHADPKYLGFIGQLASLGVEKRTLENITKEAMEYGINQKTDNLVDYTTVTRNNITVNYKDLFGDKTKTAEESRPNIDNYRVTIGYGEDARSKISLFDVTDPDILKTGKLEITKEVPMTQEEINLQKQMGGIHSSGFSFATNKTRSQKIQLSVKDIKTQTAESKMGLKKAGYNPDLLQTIVTDIENRTGKEPPLLDVLTIYNKSVPLHNYGKNLTAYEFKNSKSMDEATARVAPNIMSGGRAIWKLDHNTNTLMPATNMSADERKKLAKDLADGKAFATGFASVTSGTGFGDVVKATDATYVVETGNVEFKNFYEKHVKGVFDFIRSSDPTQAGKPFVLLDKKTGSAIVARGYKDYVYDESVGAYVENVEFRQVDQNGNLLYESVEGPNGTTKRVPVVLKKPILKGYTPSVEDLKNSAEAMSAHVPLDIFDIEKMLIGQERFEQQFGIKQYDNEKLSF